jgi:hypothetical protein
MSSNASTVRAIETRYAGCNFRSRLEARWAVFFDALGIRWEYEPQGFVGAYGAPYLPDFLLPDVNPQHAHQQTIDDAPECHGLYVEVKGSDDHLIRDESKIVEAIEWKATPVCHGLLLLGAVPRVDGNVAQVTHSMLSWRKGIQSMLVQFARVPSNCGSTWCWGVNAPHLLAYGSGYTSDESLPNHTTTFAQVRQCAHIEYRGKVIRDRPVHAPIADAYNAARSARFEHGHSGAS